ncbi:unnamed protein product [Polarella glacialis]|uniref:non-specific serine/threonine protein kinase n=1 Tax=Polarella glacialis TaxID=89957 RepID=A0A813JY54_POLGL|nr:unnamed protein product [Polarella glacialis]
METELDLSGLGFTTISRLGKGGSATTQVVRDSADGRICVAKCVLLDTLSKHHQELAKQEVFLLQALRHPYVVTYCESFFMDGTATLVILTEHCEGGDLRRLILRTAGSASRFTEDQVMMWLSQIALALQYIHGKKVLHRDLKASNLFLDKNAAVKLGDFGISKVLEGTADFAATLLGTPYYMSPEVCCNELYSWKSDIWSFGCVLYELCMLKRPFESEKLPVLVHMITNDLYDPIPDLYSDGLRSLLCQMLTKSAAARPFADEILDNSYVHSYMAKLDSLAPDLSCGRTPPGTPPATSRAPGVFAVTGTPPGTPPGSQKLVSCSEKSSAAARAASGGELVLD